MSVFTLESANQTPYEKTDELHQQTLLCPHPDLSNPFPDGGRLCDGQPD